MAEWTELLPKGVINPIVVEVLHPMHQKPEGPQAGENPPEMNPQLRADLERLAGDAAFNESKKNLLQKVGADHFTMLFIGTEHWRGKEQGTAAGSRKTNPPGREVNITVHLPPSAARSPQEEASATQVVMDWLDASDLGKAVRRLTQGRIQHMSARGRRYDNIRSIGQIVKPEDIQLTIGPTA